MTPINFVRSAVAVAALGWGFSAAAASLTEGFDTVVPAGWTAVNNSVPLGITGWFQGNDQVFPAFAGAPNSYAGVNFNSGAGVASISNWLITPTLSFNNGDVVSFYTRTVAGSPFADRLELRFSSVGGIDVGTTATSVGTFTTLLLSVNPTLATGGYPEDWTQYTATISGLGGPTNGALALRYFVTSGGPNGANSDYIGVDSFSITPVPEPSTYLLMGLGVAALALRRKRSA